MHGLLPLLHPTAMGTLRLDDGLGHAVGKTGTSRIDDDDVLGAKAPVAHWRARSAGDPRATRHYSCRRALCNDADEVTALASKPQYPA